jgi:hypothetical protein
MIIMSILSSEYIQLYILNALYETFEASSLTPWIKPHELRENIELKYLDEVAVDREINYLAEKKFLIGGSSTGYSPFTQVRLNGEGIERIRFVLKNFPLFLKDQDDKECQLLYNQLAAMSNETGKRLEILGFIKRHPSSFDEFVDKTNAISSNPIPYIGNDTTVGNTYYTGDVFQNIQNSTIVSKSSVQNAFNKLKDKEISNALVKVADFINESGDKAAGSLFNHFTEELNKSPPDKSRLKGLWSGIVSVLPTVNSVTGTVDKIMSLFN